MRPLELHISALTETEWQQYALVIDELCPRNWACALEDGVVNAREARAWIRGRYPGVGVVADDILGFFSPDFNPGDMLTYGQLFAALRMVVHVDSGQQLHRGLAFIQVITECDLSPPQSDRMRMLGLDASALSDAEYELFGSILVELCDPDSDISTETFNARELRAWILGRYPRVEAGIVDTILHYFTDLSPLSALFVFQLYAVLRLVLHANSGKEVHEGLVFVQATWDPPTLLSYQLQFTQDSYSSTSAFNSDMPMGSHTSSSFTVSSSLITLQQASEPCSPVQTYHPVPAPVEAPLPIPVPEGSISSRTRTRKSALLPPISNRQARARSRFSSPTPEPSPTLTNRRKTYPLRNRIPSRSSTGTGTSRLALRTPPRKIRGSSSTYITPRTSSSAFPTAQSMDSNVVAGVVKRRLHQQRKSPASMTEDRAWGVSGDEDACGSEEAVTGVDLNTAGGEGTTASADATTVEWSTTPVETAENIDTRVTIDPQELLYWAL